MPSSGQSWPYAGVVAPPALPGAMARTSCSIVGAWAEREEPDRVVGRMRQAESLVSAWRRRARRTTAQPMATAISP